MIPSAGSLRTTITRKRFRPLLQAQILIRAPGHDDVYIIIFQDGLQLQRHGKIDVHCHRVSAEGTGCAGAADDDHTYGVRLPLYI